jgi:hypothetical protein
VLTKLNRQKVVHNNIKIYYDSLAFIKERKNWNKIGKKRLILD